MIADFRYNFSIFNQCENINCNKFQLWITERPSKKFSNLFFIYINKSADHMDRCHLVYIFSHLTRFYLLSSFFLNVKVLITSSLIFVCFYFIFFFCGACQRKRHLPTHGLYLRLLFLLFHFFFILLHYYFF